MSGPSLQLFIEPDVGGTVHYLRMAPNEPGGPEQALINVYVKITNHGSTQVTVSKIRLAATGTPQPVEKPFTLDSALVIPAGATRDWQNSDDFIVTGTPQTLQIDVTCDGYADPSINFRALVAHDSPTPSKSFGFWGRVRDLRPGEYWAVNGTNHENTYQQLYAYDVGVRVDASATGHLQPGRDGSQNSDYRIWGKPLYAICDGTITAFRNDFPVNPYPGPVDLGAGAYVAGMSHVDGNGNFVAITTSSGGETVLYAHMQAGSINPALLFAGATVKEGDFIGLAGNAGAAGAPHLHIHSNRKPATPTVAWEGPGRPLPLHGARAISWPSLLAASVSHKPELASGIALEGRGIPPGDWAIWPSDGPRVDLHDASVAHFAISDSGRLWVVGTDHAIRTTNDRLPGRGIFLDVNPGGQGKEVALFGEKPYVIGMDNKIWEGLPDGWHPIANSPTCAHFAVNPKDGSIWVVSTSGSVAHFHGGTWNTIQGIQAIDICIGGSEVFAIDSENRVRKHLGLGWTAVPGDQKGVRIAGESNGRLWVVAPDNKIMYLNNGGTKWNEYGGGGKAKDIALFQGNPFVISTGNHLWSGVANWGWFRLNIIQG